MTTASTAESDTKTSDDDYADRLTAFLDLQWDAMKGSAKARRQRDDLCADDPAMARYQARRGRELAKVRAVYDQRRRGITPTVTGARGHERRVGDNARPRGSKRTTGSGTTSSGEDSDPELRPRRCKACGADISELLKPGPGRPRTHCEDPECKRTRNRAYVRKHRGKQWVLVRWAEIRPLAGNERHTHIDDNGPRERTYTIVGEHLSAERDPQDAAQARLEKLATDFLIASAKDRPIPHGGPA